MNKFQWPGIGCSVMVQLETKGKTEWVDAYVIENIALNAGVKVKTFWGRELVILKPADISISTPGLIQEGIKEGDDVFVLLLIGPKNKKVWFSAKVIGFSCGQTWEDHARINVMLTDSKVEMFGCHSSIIRKGITEQKEVNHG